MDSNYPEGAPPLDPNEIDGLLLTHVTTQQELNRWEQQNILKAEEWAFGKIHKEILSQRFICQLHKKMFGGSFSSRLRYASHSSVLTSISNPRFSRHWDTI